MTAMGAAPARSSGEFNVPDDLRERDQWLLWRSEMVKDREEKVPYSVRGSRASSTDPRTWSSFEVALNAWCRNPRGYSGLGFVFIAGGGLVGIDLDDCLDSDEPKPWAQPIIEHFFDTYMEMSPSGTGIKIWARGSLPANLPGVKVSDGQIEMYDHARYFTVTGSVFRGAPLQVEDHAEDVRALYERLTSGSKGAWKLQPLVGGRIPHGQQHSTLVSIAGTLRARRVCDQAIEACLQAINRYQCERPGPPENIARIVASTRSWRSR
jgi:primase-polymerase (primpol)-like protein